MDENVTDELFTLYKLIILYLLDRVDFPLTGSHISSFLLEKGYTNYFTLQKAFAELRASSLIRGETIRNATHYHITEEGQRTLVCFLGRIPHSIREEADLFLREHRIELRDETSVTADYVRTADRSYAVRCTIREKAAPLLDLTLYVPDEKEADAVCRSWKETSISVYRTLLTQLLRSP